MQRILLEVAIASVQDAICAQDHGADRLELNSALELGGLTPSLGTLIEVKRAVSLPVMVMIRPRAGNFVYESALFQIMLRDIDLALEYGADGIVFGLLTVDHHVDLPRSREIMRRLGDRPGIFHRAFDLVTAPLESLDELIDLGVRRVLTSGQQPSALQGAEMIARLVKRAPERIEILPAAGIHPGTVREVVRKTGCVQVHGSFRTGEVGSGARAPGEQFAGTGRQTSAQAILQTRRILDDRPEKEG